jgi:hypothetical protein
MDKSPAETDGSSSVSLPVFTGMVFGDDTGEAYVRSLAMFMEGIIDDKEVSQMSESDAAGLLQVKEHIRKRVEKLTRGASTIADKVAAIVLEEKMGQPSDVDTRVPKALWQQDFDTEMGDATETTTTTAPVEEKVGESNDVFKDDNQDMQIDQPTEPEDAVMEDAIVPEGGEAEATAAATSIDVELKDAEVKSEEREDIHQQQQLVKDGKDDEKTGVRMTSSQAEPEMIDIRQVVRDIKAWPQAQKVKADYESWRQLKIELDSLLPLAPADEKVRIEWGQSWTGGNSEESRKWVRESLEKNSTDMRKIVELVAAKTAEDQSKKTTTDASAEGTMIEDKGKTVKDKDVEAVTLSDEDKALVQRLTKSIRERLAEMTKYVPLSEINPQKLPPPIVPTAPAPAPTPAPAAPTPATATPAPAPVAPTVATPATVASVAASPALTATASPTVPAAGSAVATPAIPQATPVASVAPVAPTTITTPTAVTASASVSAAPTPSAPPTTLTSTAAMEAPKPSLSPGPTSVSVPTSVAVRVLASPTATGAKATERSTVSATTTSEPSPAALSTSTTTEAATSQPSTTSAALIVEPTDVAAAAPESAVLSKSVAAVASSDREGSVSSLSSPGLSP